MPKRPAQPILNLEHIEIILIIFLNQFLTSKSTKKPVKNPKST